MPIRLLPLIPQRTQLPEVYGPQMDTFLASLPGFVDDTNLLASNLNSIAAGGAYAIPYVFGQAASVGGVAQTAHILALSSGVPENTATALFVDITSGAGKNVAAQLDNLVSGATSSIKGTFRVCAQSDPSKYLVYAVTGIVVNTYYRTFAVTCVDSSAASPFANGDAVILFFQRTGDKGDAGALTQVLWVRDERSANVGGGSNTGGLASDTRTLNTVKKNTISGASLASNVITLPAGTYRISASAPAYNVGAHRMRIQYSVSGGGSSIEGSSSSATGSNTTNSMIINSEVTFAATAALTVLHMTQTTATSGLGVATNGNGSAEVYTEVFIEKVS